MELDRVRQELAKMEEDLYGTCLGGQAGNVAWLQVVCEYVNALPEDEAIEWRDVHAEQVLRALWYTPEALIRMKGKRTRA